MTTSLDLDEELVLQEGGWRGRAITFAMLLVIGAFAAAAVYYFFLREEDETLRTTEDIPVKRATINSTLIISGTSDAQLNSDLNFQSSGRVKTVSAKVGDVVQEGQVLASLDSAELTNAVAQAQAAVVSGELKLQDLLQGASAAELATAEQAVAQAQSGLAKAENDLQSLRDGASAADLAAAEQTVQLAESQLAGAEATLQKLEDAPSDADLAAAEYAVAAAESALTAAENSADSAENSRDSARASLLAAEASYCALPPADPPDFCTSGVAPITTGDLGKLNTALSVSGEASLASLAITANNGYLSATNSADSADAAVDAAQDALDSAEAKLDAVQDGASADDLAAAEAAVAAAEAQVASAQARLADLKDGADAGDITTAESAVAAAEASLESAEERLAEARRGPDANAIAQAQQAVRTAMLTLEAAQIRVKNAQIIAPFSGTVAAVNITPGEFASAALQPAAIVMLTPDAMVLKIDVGETDYPSVTINQGGAALFDGIPGKIYPFRITEIGLAPTVTQGVVTFKVTATIAILEGNPRPAPGMNARGQLTVGSKPDVLVVPPRAIRRRGSEQVVDVRRDTGVEEVVVATGVSDNQNVEIVSGLEEGDIVVVPSVAGGAGSGGPTPVPTIPGGIR